MVWVLMLVWLLGAAEARAQLAITEVMSWASTNCAGCPETGERGCRPDFWELTNFGTNTIDLTGYLFADQHLQFPGAGWPWQIPPGVIIRPNESVIFVREGWPLVSDAMAFREWWGEDNLPTNLQIFCCYFGYLGFDGMGDAVRLFDPETNLVDQIYFGETRRGFTFAYDTNSGVAMQSELGVCGAFQAAICDDVGSPGWAPCGPVALRITQQPVSQTNDAGSDVTLSVRAVGLPQPRYQWYFNGTALVSGGATNSSIPRLAGFAGCGPAWIESPVPPDLTIPNVQPSHAGEYFVEVFNGLERITSAVVRLTVNTNPTPARLECPPALACVPGDTDLAPPALIVAPGQPAILTAMARGYPLPTLQWSRSVDGRNFVEMTGETNRSLVIPVVQLSNAGIYRVRAQNPGGATSGDVTLIVKEQPRLKITEAMSDPCFTEGNDWWELTNLGDQPVNLCGYRWDDLPGNIGGGPTVTNAVIIQPGESVIFLEGRTPEFFTEWWGASNLPPRMQFIRHTANGLEPDGDAIHIWNPTATNDHDTVDTNDFSTSKVRGASFWFETFVCQDSEGVRYDTYSVEGDCGAFRAVQGCDVGSPGWTRWTPPQLTSISRNGAVVQLEWKAQPGSSNIIEYTSSLAPVAGSSDWANLVTSNFTVTGATGTAVDTNAGPDVQRFYRVKKVSPANCPCPEASPQ